MAIGDQADFVARLRSVLPAGWFPTPQVELDGSVITNSPILDAILSGPAWSLSWLYALISYAKQQTRIATATDVWLDIIAQDYFGAGLQRRTNETDTAYSARIRRSLFAPRATRAAMISVLTALTGNAPVIFEPGNTGDTGGWSGAGVPSWEGLAWGTAGGYGDLKLPFQAFITAYRPLGQGIASVAGWGGSVFAGMPGGWGVGQIEYTSADMVAQTITDTDIYATIAATQPAGSIMWTAITAPKAAPVVQPVTPPVTVGSELDVNFYLDESELQ